MAQSPVPEIGDRLRRRLERRFGPSVGGWLDDLPGVLTSLAERWEVVLGPPIERGSMSAVLRCRTADGSSAVLKVSPDRRRVAEEAAALRSWTTAHVPRVLAVDPALGAVLLEAIQPGTALDESATDPDMGAVASLISALHRHPGPRPDAFGPLRDRISRLFESGSRNYERRPGLTTVVPPTLYERSRRVAMRLAADTAGAVLLHGDLTPVNVLDGGPGRGLVAIDPAPCWGDAAFDAVDLLLWRADDPAEVESRGRRLAAASGLPYQRLSGWCAAFAAMSALEIAEASDDVPDRAHMLVRFALSTSDDPA